MSDRKMEVDAWLSQPVTQDLIFLVMRSAAQARENAVSTLSAKAQGECEAFRFVLNEIVAVALYADAKDRENWLAESPVVVEDALARRRMDG